MTEPSPPSRPASPAVPSTNERNDQVVADESAPLLASDTSSEWRVTSPKVIRSLTFAAIVSSSTSLVVLIAKQIVIWADTYYYRAPWVVGVAEGGTVIPALFSVFISAVNVARLRRRRPLPPLGINLILDILIAVFAISYAAQGLSAVIVPDYNDSWDGIASRILSGVTLGTALIFGIVHLILFALRCRMAFLMESWRSPWPFPNGQFTVEFSIKFFREPESRRQGGEEIV